MGIRGMKYTLLSHERVREPKSEKKIFFVLSYENHGGN